MQRSSRPLLLRALFNVGVPAPTKVAMVIPTTITIAVVESTSLAPKKNVRATRPCGTFCVYILRDLERSKPPAFVLVLLEVLAVRYNQLDRPHLRK